MGKERCDVCGKAFDSQQGLKQHRRDTGHTKGKVGAYGRTPLRLLVQPKMIAVLGVGVLVIVIGAILGWSLLSGRQAGSPGQTEDLADLPQATVGRPAPEIAFTTVNGETRQLSDFRGEPVMLWLIATWCSTCQKAAQALTERIDELERYGLVILTLKLYDNLGYPGPAIVEFGKKWAGAAYDSPNWLWADASQRASFIYDPKGYPDIYWLIDRDGAIQAVDTAPHVTMNRIIEFARTP